MAWQRKLWTLVGLGAGAAVGFWLWRQGEERLAPAPEPRTPRNDAVGRLRNAFAADADLDRRTLEVNQISGGVMEITGAVADREERERAVAIAHNDPDVHTVVNRIVVEPEEARLRERQARNEAGGAIHHTGMGVGMGRRRQSPETDPDRPGDRQKRVDRELEVDKMVDDVEGVTEAPDEEPSVSEGAESEEDRGGEGPEDTPRP